MMCLLKAAAFFIVLLPQKPKNVCKKRQYWWKTDRTSPWVQTVWPRGWFTLQPRSGICLFDEAGVQAVDYRAVWTPAPINEQFWLLQAARITMQF